MKFAGVAFVTLLAPGMADQCCYPSCGSQGCNAPGEWCSQSQSNCEGSCTGHFCPSGPTPTPGPTPPTPPPGPKASYCPSANDITVAYGTPQLNNQGWTVHGNGGVATKSTFNLLGGSVEFDIDFSGVGKGVNANIYTISPSIAASGYTPDKYCDGAAMPPKEFCLEVDWVESNGACGGATTLHTIQGPGPNGCTSWGCRSSYAYDGKTKFHMKIEHGEDGTWTTYKDGASIGTLNPAPSGNDWSILKSNYEKKGALIYSSEWEGWVPLDKQCGAFSTDKALLARSHFTVSNLKIVGSVVQGPTPTRCASENSTVVV